MKLSRRAFTLAAPATLLAAPLLTPSIARAADSITVYNAQHASLTKAWATGFTKATGIAVTLRDGSDTAMGNQIVQEGHASPADVFLTENSPAMVLVDKAGLFARLSQKVLDEVPSQFRAPNGDWVGVAARSTVFAYDTRKLTEAQLPASMLDLARPEWKGRWAASPSGADFQAIVSALLQLKGPEATEAWLKGMKANAVAYRGNSTALKAVSAGEVEGALIYHYYWFRDQAKTAENSANTKLHYFRHQDPGAFVSLSGGGVLASSKHKAAAEAFLGWVAGPGGQAVLRTGDSFEYAVGVGAASNPKLVKLADLQAPKVDPSGLNSAEVTALMLKAGLL
jgi:iron(III) transport system substrate-binding protein